MKKCLKNIFAIVITLAMVVGLSSVALATKAEEATVTYDGTAQKFIFAPGSKESPTDLFPKFKSVMPGDKLTQKIVINNKISDKVKINVFLRSKGAESGSEELLSKFNLTVDQVGSSNLFKAPADQKAGLSDWKSLGTIYSGGKIELELTLEVPSELGNEFQNKVGKLEWEFKVEELPIEPDDPAPQTGVFTNFTLLFSLMGVAVVGGTFAIVLISKKKKEQE